MILNTRQILEAIGQFSEDDLQLFENATRHRQLRKNELLLAEGQVCQSFCFIRSGAFFQYREKDISEIIIDLHLENEWIFNHQSLMSQVASDTNIKAFIDSEILELSLTGFHYLSARSPVFLQFGKILNPSQNRTFLFDNSLSPAERYEYILRAKPGLAQIFPVKMIASYLKIAPETLSRVRARQ